MFSLAKTIVNQVRRGLATVENQIMELARKPIAAMVQQVINGDWEGDDADAFCEQCSRLLLPEVDRALGGVRLMNTSIGKAVDIIDAADNKSFRAVEDVIGKYRAI